MGMEAAAEVEELNCQTIQTSLEEQTRTRDF